MTGSDNCQRCGGERTESAHQFSDLYCLPCFNSPQRVPEGAEAYLRWIAEGGAE